MLGSSKYLTSEQADWLISKSLLPQNLLYSSGIKFRGLALGHYELAPAYV